MLCRLGLDFTSGRTELCKHCDGCVEDILKFTSKSFLMGYTVTASIDIILMLIKQMKKIRKNPMIILYTLISKKNVRFASFPALYTFIMRGLTCLLRRFYKKDDKYVSFLSGFVGGLVSLWVREKENRSIWALFLITRALDSLYRSQVINKRIPKISLDYTIVYCLMIGYTVSIYFTEPNCNSRGLHKAWENFSCESQPDYGIRLCYMERHNNKIDKIGLPRNDPNKYINWNRRF